MEKGKSKRSNDAAAEGGEEEQKMEEFFALIRSFQEARNRRMSELEDGARKKAKSRRLSEEKTNWVPSFEWQDFREEICFRKNNPLIFAGSSNNKDEKFEKLQQNEDIGDDGLDLKLTL